MGVAVRGGRGRGRGLIEEGGGLRRGRGHTHSMKFKHEFKQEYYTWKNILYLNTADLHRLF